MNEGRRRAAAGLALGLGALGLAAIPASKKRVPAGEAGVFELVNDLPDSLRTVVWPVMQGGGLAAVPVAAALLRATGHPRAAAQVGAGGAVAWALAKGVKRGVGRGRPAGLVGSVRVRGAAQTGGGFPSGHAAVATTLALGAATAVPRLRPALVGAAAVVCLSRVYVAAHLPLDVVGGAGLGVAVHSAIRILAPEGPA